MRPIRSRYLDAADADDAKWQRERNLEDDAKALGITPERLRELRKLWPQLLKQEDSHD